MSEALYKLSFEQDSLTFISSVITKQIEYYSLGETVRVKYYDKDDKNVIG